MPELPDVVVYIERLAAEFAGATLEDVRVRSPSLLRTAEPPLSSAFGRRVVGFERLGKRIVTQLEGDLFLVLHLMIAGRLKLAAPRAALPGKVGIAAFDFDRASLILTEASSHKRAQLHVVQGRAALAEHDRGGLEVLGADLAAFREAVLRENHTLKRTLTDPRLLSGIGNAYSDEILHAAKLSPFALSDRLDEAAVSRLYEALRAVLTDALKRAVGQRSATLKAEKRSGMAVHGRAGLPCPVCGDTVREVSFSGTSLQYCPTCQTSGRPLADRRMSRLLK
jgi:formamidopyrimidine-DNA glycosylase